MPAAPNIASKTVTGTYRTPDDTGIPVAGTLRFIPSDTVQDITGHVLVSPFPLEVDLVGGSFSIPLMVTDDPDSQPVGWTWHLSELWPGGRDIDFFLPSSSPNPVDISTILPASEVESFFQYASITQVDDALAVVAATNTDLNTRMDLIDLDSAVVTATVVVHPFLLMGA